MRSIDMHMRANFVPTTDRRPLRVLGSAMSVIATTADTGGALEIVEATSGAGGDIIPHRHPWPEAYYVLEGGMVVQVGARMHECAPGDFVTIPAKSMHGFRVTSESARFLHISLGAGAIAAFEDFDRNVPGVPELDDLPSILEVNGRHGIELPASVLA
jgi:quercetin dioxygenase-like cupin family protein